MSFQNFINKIGKSHLIYAQVRKDGKIIEDWSRFASKPRFESYSAAKTFAGIGVGIAIDEGLISLDEKIIDSFKEESYDVTNPYAYDITVRDMLTMSSGLSNTLFWKDGWERKHEQDWTRYFFKITPIPICWGGSLRRKAARIFWNICAIGCLSL